MKLIRLSAIAAALLTLASAATASAAKFEAGKYSAQLSGPQVASENFVFTVEGGLAFKCKEVTLSGELTAASTEIELAPTFKECTASGLSASISAEGCKYRFNADTYDVDIVCPAGKTMKYTVFTCEIRVGGQNGLETVEYLDSEGSPTTFAVEFLTVEKVKYNKTADGFLCPLSGTGEKSDGTYKGEFVMKALAGESQVAANAQAGVWMRVNPNSWDFGQVKVGSQVDRGFFLRYVGGGNSKLLKPFPVNEGNLSYSISAEACTGAIAHGQHCSLTVRFKPDGTGKKKAKITVDEDGGALRQFEFPVEGEGIP
jgi:hypothetical protein